MDYSGSNKTKGNFQMDATGQVHSVADQVCPMSPVVSCVSVLFFLVFQQDLETGGFCVLDKPNLEDRALRQHIG